MREREQQHNRLSSRILYMISPKHHARIRENYLLFKGKYFLPRKLNPFISKDYFHLWNDKFFSLRDFEVVSLRVNLVIIGAQKSGTSSLYHWLDRHPDIFMSKPIKEPGYFCDFDFIRGYFRNLSWVSNFRSRTDILKNYILQGYQGEPVIGEASTYYTDGSRDVSDSMYTYNPSMKLIYILRNPIGRVISNYLHNTKKEKFKGSLDEFIVQAEKKQNRSILRSLYGQRLQPFLERFPRKNIKILIFEEMLKNPGGTIDDVLDFLDLESFSSELSYKKYNQSPNRDSFREDELLLRPEQYEWIMGRIMPDLELFEQLTGTRLDRWDLAKAMWCRKTR